LPKSFKVEKSQKMFQKAQKLIPEGVNSSIRGPSWGVIPGVHPMYVDRAKGSKLFDVDGNEYIDYVLGYGPVILGHSHPKVNQAVRKQLEKGTLYGLSHENEIKVAEKINKAVPCAEMVRLTSTGTEANIGAVRIARAYTGKDKIAKFELSYHGWEDNLLVGASGGLPINYFKTASPGVPKSTLDNVIVLPWNNLDAVEKILKRNADETALVMTEMFGDGWIGPKEGFLKELRRITQENGILLLFDEVKTGFRIAYGGAQELFGIMPDLATYAKAIGNGFPIAAITGKKEIMQTAEQARLAGTFNACPLNTAAAVATLTELETDYKNRYAKFLGLGRKLQKGVKEAIQDLGIEAIVQGPDTMFKIAFTQLEEVANLKDTKTLDEAQNQKRNAVFAREFTKRGIWGHPNHAWFTSMAHTPDDIERTRKALYDSLKEVKQAT
jgi:glutamate-1-semialdehyde 2,1-aminomutase